MKRNIVFSVFTIIIFLIVLSCREKSEKPVNTKQSDIIYIDTIIKAEAAGQILTIHVNSGDVVEINDLLISIDDEAIIARLSVLVNERNSIERIQQNRRTQSQESELILLNQQISHTEEQLNNLQVLSPINGKVSKILINEKEFVTIGKELLVLQTQE